MLPPWGPVNWDNFSQGLWLVVAGVLSALGGREAVKRINHKPEEKSFEVVGTLGPMSDPRVAKELKEAIEMQRVAVDRQTEVIVTQVTEIKRHTDEIRRQTTVMERSNEMTTRVMDSAAELRREMSDLRHALDRVEKDQRER